MWTLKILIGIEVAALLTSANYVLFDDYKAEEFADMFDFVTFDDPTHGIVNYVNRETAVSKQLFYVTENGSVYIGVDNKNIAAGRGRDSIRLHSKATYNHGLFILDLAHIPGSVCSTWPAYWLLGRHERWPLKGEINVIEGVNNEKFNLMSLHSTDGCTMSASEGTFTGNRLSKNCYIKAPGQHFNQGCSIKAKLNNTYGDGFNEAKGGVYVTDWTSKSVRMWMFQHKDVPEDIKEGRPNPDSWKQLPLATFSGDCEFDSKFKDMGIIFDITFCGDWADNVWREHCEKQEKTNCENFTRNTPSAFKETYWLVNSLRVYQNVTSFSKWNGANDCQKWNGHCVKEERCFNSLGHRSKCGGSDGGVCCLPNADDICLNLKCDKVHQCLGSQNDKSLNCNMLKHCGIGPDSYNATCSSNDVDLICCASLPKVQRSLFGEIKRVEKEQRCVYINSASNDNFIKKLCVIGVAVLICLITSAIFIGMRLSNVREASQFYQPRMPQFNEQVTKLTNLSTEKASSL